MTRPSRHLIPLLLALGLLLPLAAAPASAASSYDAVVDITFPVAGLGYQHFTNDYEASRGGGARVHRATDIGAPDAYGLPVHAARGGTVRTMTGVTSAVPGYGYMISIDGDDGRRYNYIHLGRQDGPTSEAYAPGLSPGDHVRRGQHIGYLGHSGNASPSWPHLHFEIVDARITDPHGSNRMNPYASLVAALDRGDVPGGFLDVHGSAHLASIRAIAEAGITEGCAANRYCPDRAVTRGQMATFLSRALELPGSSARPFPDVPASHPHAPAIAAVAEAGIAKGDTKGRFRPNERIRRDQMASLLAAALELPNGDTTSFPDVNTSSVHAGAIASLAELGITQGNGRGEFQPSRSTDRGQMASFLDRAFLQ